jgi:mannosyl-3-phosphoglycerate phosphatase
LERHRIPLVFISNGTRMELEFVRRRIGNTHPFITESGGGLFIPEGYFRLRIPDAAPVRHYHCISFARPYAETCEALDSAAAEAQVEVVGFHHMSAREVAENAGLPARAADLARLREYDEPFFFAGEESRSAARLAEVARARGWQVSRGERFWHFSSGAHVARALHRLMELFRQARHTRLRSVAIGWSSGHAPMLTAASRAVLLPAPDGNPDEQLARRVPGAKRAALGGVEGWNAAVEELLEKSS